MTLPDATRRRLRTTGGLQVIPPRRVWIRDGVKDRRLQLQAGVSSEELTPDECRTLAQELTWHANDCEKEDSA